MADTKQLLDTQLMQHYKKRWQAVARVQKLEAATTTFEQRWRETNAILLMAAELGLPLSQDKRVEKNVMRRWKLLKGVSGS